MKLIKQTAQNKDDDQCTAITNSGTRCKRKSSKGPFCRQHLKIQESIIKHISKYGGAQLHTVPDTPPTLTGQYADRWRQLCETLLDLGILYGSMLRRVMALIVYEQIEDDLMEDLQNKQYSEYLNKYVTETGSTGNQVNGYYTLLSYVTKQIDKLHKDLGIDSATLKRASSSKSSRKPKSSLTEAGGW